MLVNITNIFTTNKTPSQFWNNIAFRPDRHGNWLTIRGKLWNEQANIYVPRRLALDGNDKHTMSVVAVIIKQHDASFYVMIARVWKVLTLSLRFSLETSGKPICLVECRTFYIDSDSAMLQYRKTPSCLQFLRNVRGLLWVFVGVLRDNRFDIIFRQFPRT